MVCGLYFDSFQTMEVLAVSRIFAYNFLNASRTFKIGHAKTDAFFSNSTVKIAVKNIENVLSYC